MSEGVGDLLFFLASVLPVGWGISEVLTFVDERGLRGVSCIHVLYRGAFTRQGKNGTDPTKTGTVPIVFAKKQ